jgi:hypothetical protein
LAIPLLPLCDRGDLDGELQRQHDEGFEPIGFDDQKVSAVEPVIKLSKSIAAAFNFDSAIDAEQRHGHIAAKPSARGAGQRHAFRSETAVLEQVHDGAFRAVSFLS